MLDDMMGFATLFAFACIAGLYVIVQRVLLRCDGLIALYCAVLAQELGVLV